MNRYNRPRNDGRDGGADFDFDPAILANLLDDPLFGYMTKDDLLEQQRALEFQAQEENVNLRRRRRTPSPPRQAARPDPLPHPANADNRIDADWRAALDNDADLNNLDEEVFIMLQRLQLEELEQNHHQRGQQRHHHAPGRAINPAFDENDGGFDYGDFNFDTDDDKIPAPNAVRHPARNAAPDAGADQAPNPTPNHRGVPEGPPPEHANGREECISCSDVIENMVYRGPCNHPYCRDCLQGCINAALESNQLPAKCCNEPFGMAVVRVAVSLDKFNTYRDRLEELTADPNELFYCPKPRCAARITVPAGRGNEPLTCPTCRTKVCRKCRKEDHRGECKDDDGEEKLKELVGKEGWKSCPHCGRVVEKAGFGCNVMHCVCGNHWCWVCGKAKPLGGTGYEGRFEGGCDCRLFDVPPDRLQELAENDGFHDDIPRPNVFNRRRHHDVPGIHAGVEVIIRRNHARRPHDHFRHYHDHHGHRRRFYDDFDIPDEEFHPRDFHYRRRPARRFPAFNHRMAADELEDIRRLLQAEEDEIGVSDSD